MLDLPDYIGIARLCRELDESGDIVLENGVPKKVPPYILVKCGDLTDPQISAATRVVADHVPIVESLPDRRFETEAKTIEAATTLAELKAALAPLVRML